MRFFAIPVAFACFALALPLHAVAQHSDMLDGISCGLGASCNDQSAAHILFKRGKGFQMGDYAAQGHTVPWTNIQAVRSNPNTRWEPYHNLEGIFNTNAKLEKAPVMNSRGNAGATRLVRKVGTNEIVGVIAHPPGLANSFFKAKRVLNPPAAVGLPAAGHQIAPVAPVVAAPVAPLVHAGPAGPAGPAPVAPVVLPAPGPLAPVAAAPGLAPLAGGHLNI
jgi:hypothetical protein